MKCVDDFTNYRWTAADLCLSEIHYRVISVSLLGQSESGIYGMVPLRDFGSDESSLEIGHSRHGYFFIRTDSHITRNLATSGKLDLT